ncbi:MAG: hypothetical protein ACR65R_07925 [Methylomicrobium sp.]
MDNDILINQARHLYAVLLVELKTRSVNDKARHDRIDRLVDAAHSRYQRRLNRCVLCYGQRITDCDREHPKNCNQELWKNFRRSRSGKMNKEKGSI